MPAALFFRILLPFAMGNFTGSLYRSVSAVVAPDIIADLGLTAEQMGLLSSALFVLYAGIQIPLGMALDRFGARRVTGTLMVIAALGAIAFAQGDGFTTLLISRCIMGFGISVAFMGALKAMVESMPVDRLPLANSLIMTTGGLGVMSATLPIQYALNFTDWRGVFVGIAALTLIIAAAVFAGPERQRGPGANGLDALRGVARVFTHRQFWRIVPLGSSAQGVNMGMSSLWAGPWLRDVTGLSRDEAAAVLFGMAGMITVSVLCAGWAASRLTRLGIPVVSVACVMICGFIFFECLIALDVPVSPWLLWLPYSFCATGPVLFYSVLAPSFGPGLAGRVNTAYNFTTFTFVFFVQWTMGAIIDLWPSLPDGRFAPDGYRWAMGLFIAIQATAFIWFWIAPRAKMQATTAS